MPTLHKIVILGTGFGGIYSLKSIAKQLKGRAVHVTIIGRQNYFLFTPMLHEVATGVLSHYQAAVAVRELLPNKSTQYMMAQVTGIDRTARKVQTDKGDVAYDTLVIATGARTNYFGVPGAEKYTTTLKSLRDAIAFRQRITENFERAIMEKDPEVRRSLLTVVVIGGGPTGVEFSAELAEMIFDTFVQSSQGRVSKRDLRICLLHRGPSIISMFAKNLQERALQSLRAKGVEVFLGEEVVKISEGKVQTKNGEEFKASIILWVAGVCASIPPIMPALPMDASNRLVVDGTLRVPEDQAIYCIGDAAAYMGPDAKPMPMLAQVAVQQGKYLGKALRARREGREPKPFEAHMLGELVSLGSWSAIGEVFGIRIKGPLASIMWKCVYIVKFVSFPKRLKILLDWFVGLFSRRDITIS